MRGESSQELTAARCIVNVNQDVRAIIWLRPIAQHRGLNFVEIKRASTVAECRLIAFDRASFRHAVFL